MEFKRLVGHRVAGRAAKSKMGAALLKMRDDLDGADMNSGMRYAMPRRQT